MSDEKTVATLLLHKMSHAQLAELYYAASSAIEMKERGVTNRGLWFPLPKHSVVLRVVEVVK